LLSTIQSSLQYQVAISHVPSGEKNSAKSIPDDGTNWGQSVFKSPADVTNTLVLGGYKHLRPPSP
jgi:hypothetical protein